MRTLQVFSRGRLIGETDLGFVRIFDQCWSGWFHPTVDGERLMPQIVSTLPAMRAYLHRDAADPPASGTVRPEVDRSTLFADLAESFQHLQALGLELRREDGSVVPTADIGIQDTHQLLAMAKTEHDDEEWEDGDDDLFDEWMAEELDETRFPRYQIHVRLLHPNVVP